MNAMRREHGHSLVEMVIAAGIMLALAAVAAPPVKAYMAESHVLGAGRQFKGRFRLARSIATRSGVYTAMRFERRGDRWQYAIYQDGDFDGVNAADISTGRDPRIAGPFPLDGAGPGVRVGINPGIPAPPPDGGMLDPNGDAIRFGAGEMLSFSPLGGATPGTLYLAGSSRQAAVRVNGGSARVRLMIYRGTRWVELP